ncbi:hypothetical protein HYV71_03315 [Candidatus Uhrbacteria bacterium]|nr:hypothetical protein [Candidatus Uhrbacteria bacterium]
MAYPKKIQHKVFQFRQTLFWDVDPQTIDPHKNARYVIERMLNFGDMKDIHWLFGYYPKHQIKKVVVSSRSLHKKSANFWGLVFNIPKSHIRCLQAVPQKKQRLYSSN